jgi:hypothetical protein
MLDRVYRGVFPFSRMNGKARTERENQKLATSEPQDCSICFILAIRDWSCSWGLVRSVSEN